MLKGIYLWKFILRSLWRAALVTALAFLFSFLIIEPLSFSALSIFSSPEKSDFSVTDMYAQIADRRPVKTLDQDIVLIDIGHSDREKIIDILNNVSFWNPKVVGIDIMFASESPVDSLLVDAIKNIPKVVLAVGLTEESDGTFKISDKPFYYNQIRDCYAAVNLPAEFEGATIREFVTTFRLSDGKSIESFPLALARAYNPACISKLEKRGNHLETIDFPSREFLTLTPDDIDPNGEYLTDKLVIVGAFSDADDMHSTPIHSYMSGMSIQAAATSTILRSKFYDSATSMPDWLPACILCFLIVLIREFSSARIRGLITRVLQLLVVYLAVRIGYSLYVDSNKIFNFAYIMLMVTFGLFAFDIWIGLEFLSTKLYGFIKKKVMKAP